MTVLVVVVNIIIAPFVNSVLHRICASPNIINKTKKKKREKGFSLMHVKVTTFAGILQSYLDVRDVKQNEWEEEINFVYILIFILLSNFTRCCLFVVEVLLRSCT